jgi:lipopolysaccharide biosynthesis glycosyltransferase
MKNLIYQVWAGKLSEEAKVSSKLMKAYAEKIGAEYILDLNPNIASKICDVPMYFEWLNPIIDDRFLKYDKILSVDLDVFPVENLKENIFKEDVGDIGACTEPFQGKQRATVTVGGHINRQNDEKWAAVVKKNWGISLPRDEDDNLKVYNAGMVVFTKEGIEKAKEWMPFQEYIDFMRNKGFGRFYTVDQNYFHLMVFANANIDFREMNNGWNSQIHYVRGPLAITNNINDERNENTKFVHVQMTGHKWNEQSLYEIVNLSRSKWRFKYSEISR